MEDIHTDSKGKVAITVTGKGGYIRTLYLTPVLTDKLKQYILRFHGVSDSKARPPTAVIVNFI